MKKFWTKTFASKPMTVCGVLFVSVAQMRLANAAALQEARVSQVIQDVRLLEAHAAPHPAAVNDKVIQGSAVRTGAESRAELTFNDFTITRLGANTIFSFTTGARQAELTQGAILLQVRPGAPPVRANTTSVTVAVMGGTALLSTGPPSKFMVLEGNGEIYPIGHPEKSVTVHAGEMVLAEGGHVSKPEKVDVKLVLATSPLVVDFAPLANLPLILSVVNQQQAEQSVVVSNPPPYKSTFDTIDVTSQNTTSNPVVVSNTFATPTPSPAPPPPTPSEFGTPSTITSPNPYLITSGTVITTDPSITTNGVTDFGKIYRGSGDDGAFSLWAFGSTSAFDTALNIDTEFFADPNHLPIAVFKFQSLSLTGNPTIDTSNNGVTKLGLIGVDGITSGPPGSTLTFTGLDLLVLATVNGSINLTSDVSFQGLNELAMYARGAGSDLILNSPISNIAILELGAEGSIELTNPGTMSVGGFQATAGNNLTLQIGGSLSLDGKVRLNTLVLPGTTVTNGANVTLDITGDYVNSSTTESSSLNVINAGGNIGTGGNISLTTGGDFTASGDATFTIQNTTGSITDGGNLTFTAGSSVATSGVLSLFVENYDFSGNTPGHIGTGGNISLTTGGDLSAQSVIALINNRSGGEIDSPVSLTLSIGGALTTSGESTDPFGFPESLSVVISTRFDNTSGPALASIVGGDATLIVNADSASIGGRLSTIISNSGSTLNGNALLSIGIAHDVSIQGEADVEILNDADSGTPLGGMLHGSATLQLSSNNFTANALFAQIDNRDGAVIDSNATLAFNLTGSFAIPGTNPGDPDFDSTVPGEADILITNQLRATSQDPATSGGTIGGDALIQVSAASASTAGALDVEIDNFSNGSGSTGGSIGGNATISLNIAGGLTTGGDAIFNIANQNNGGTNGGVIGGNALVSVGASGDINIVGDATFQILNNGGQIGGDGNISVTTGDGGNLTANSILAQIDNHNGGMIGGTANVALSVTGNVTAPAGLTLQILNGSGGHIGTGSAADGVLYSVGGTTSTTNLLLYVDSSNGGFIDNGGNVTLQTTGPVAMDGPLQMEVDSYNGGVINTGANVTGVFVGDVTDTTGSGHSFNFFVVNGDTVPSSGFTGGTIGTGGNISLVFDGNVETNGTPTTGAFAAVIDNGGGSIGTGGNILVAIGGNEGNGNVLSLAIVNNQGNIGTGGNIDFSVAGDVTQVGTMPGAMFNLLNEGGTIGSSPAVDISAHNFSNAGTLMGLIDNSNAGTINGSADVSFNLTGDLTTQGDVTFTIDNSNGGTIGGNATIDVTATNITANSLTAQIDNTGGSIGANTEGGATINMNVANSATVTTDATVAIYGSDGTGGAAIDINGGNYNVGGQFLTYIDGNGTITFNNATAHADVLKAGVFGANGVLNVFGGMLSADTTLELYASGSNGSLNFFSNVTLGGNAVKILAANSITIFDNIVVTINGPAAQVYTNNANYTGFGGNGTTTGTFAGSGANNPQPLANAPPFGPAPSSRPNGRPGNHGAENRGIINVSNTAELLALLDGAAVGPDGRITMSSPTMRRDLSRINMNGLPRGVRQMLIHEMRDRRIDARVDGRRL